MGQGARLSAWPDTGVTRRAWLGAAAAGLAACGQPGPADLAALAATWAGGWVGDAAEAGHRWRDGRLVADGPAGRQASGPVSGPTRRTDVLIVGAGVAGLAAAYALRQAGVQDIALLELHGQPGGNSRGHVLAGQACPLGAHYLPVPGPAARELLQWLHEIGLARHALGRTRWDERHLAHAPQERLWFDGAWHEGLLPPLAPGSAGLAQAQRLSRQVSDLQRTLGFAMPSTRAVWGPGHAALDQQTFAAWLATQGISDAALRWYLDYCCRDDYGAPADQVSAWAGLHYFASRHGFAAPGEANDDEPAQGVLTWPQGNAWLVDRLATGLGERLLGQRLVTQVAPSKHGVDVTAWHLGHQAAERWQARQVVLAVPLAWAARLLASPPQALRQAAGQLRSAPWLVANVHLAQPPLDRPGMPRAWDNVVYGRQALGYVHAQHQQLSATADTSTVITAYHALPVADRAALLQQPWRHWAQQVVAELSQVHPDLPAQVKQVDLARHGHAMAMPQPGVRGSTALATLRQPGALGPRLHLAHADLVGYSVFEEAFTLGAVAGAAVASALRGRAGRRG
jgi:monoamine oxidase